MRKTITTLLACMICTLMVQAQTYWDGTADKNLPGEGTEASPYLISTPEQLAGLAERTNVDKEDFAGKYIKLTADIYLTDYTDPNTENWKEWHPIAHEWWKNESEGGGIDHGYFRGHFDGDGHTIYNLYYNGGAGWGSDWNPDDPFFDPEAFIGALDVTAFNRGLFANVDGGTIENLNIGNARMNGVGSMAMLAVFTTNGTVIRNCHVQGEFRGTASGMGGIVSDNKGLIENCSANVNIVTGGGGIVVHTNGAEGIVRNSTASGNILATAMSTGAFANTNDGLIEKCSSSADVTALYGKQDNGKYWEHDAGGFLAINTETGTVRECSATGNLTIDRSSGGSGGFCQTNMGLIESCYCTGTITNKDNAGVAQFVANNGMAQSVQEGYPVIRNCFSTSKIVYTNVESDRNCFGAFVYNYNAKSNHDFARHAFCWFNADGVPVPSNGGVTNGGFACWGQEEAVLKSQAFVDTLNLCASFLGTSQWELKEGIPQPTGVYIKNTQAFFDGGEGTKDSPYLINNKEQLENFRWLVNHGYDFMNEYVLQTADIELNVPEEEWEEAEPEEWVPIGIQHSFPGFYNDNFYISSTEMFMGNYDGGFHEIKNLYIENNQENQGLFGYVGASNWVFDGQQPVVIQNLGVTGAFMVVKGGSGILAASVGKGGIIKQCWTSGKLETPDNWGNLGALFGNGCNEGSILNCSSSARIKGTSNGYYGAKGFVSGNEFSGGWIAADTLVNYLFTGNINNGESGFYGGGYYSENVYEDGEAANITHDGRGQNGVRSTAWLQSKEYVNQLNATVQRWNSENDEAKQLNYWQWRENDYPVVSPQADYDPGYAITFNSNGGTEVAGMMVVEGSTIQPPVRPKKENYLFGGWYKDEELTQLFKFGSEPVEQDLTLFARWLEDTRFDYDITPFSNKRAKTYHIKTAAQLRGFAYLQNGVWQDASATELPRDFSEKTIVLDNDIFLNDTTGWEQWGKGAYAVPWRAIGTKSNSYQSTGELWFTGTFDGQGHVIYGMYVERGGLPSLELGGLFYRVGDGATIQNLGIEASVLNLDMQNPEGQTNGERWYYWGDGTYWMEHPGMLANLFGSKTTVSQCYTQGAIYMPTDNGWGGALTGMSADSTANCYARVDIYQKGNIAEESGFISNPHDYLNMTNCYNAGKVHDGMGRGGLSVRDGFESFYYDKELLSCDYDGSYYGTLKERGRTTNEMKAKSTFEGWDFETIWGRNNSINDGYPYLRLFHPDAPADDPDPVKVTGIQLNVTEATLMAGETLQLIATVLPADAVNKNITWEVTGESSWITLDDNGLVTANMTVDKNGYNSGKSETVYVNVTTVEGAFKASCKITVKQPNMTSGYEMTPLDGRRVGSEQWRSQTDYPNYEPCLVNWQYKYLFYTDPEDFFGDSKNAVWSVSDESMASVETLGDTIITVKGKQLHASLAMLTFLKEGETTLKVKTEQGFEREYQMRSRLFAPADDSFMLIYTQKDYAGEALSVGQTLQLYTNYTKYGSYYNFDFSYEPDVQWESSDPTIATVDESGLLTVVGDGKVTITAKLRGTSLSATRDEIVCKGIPVTSVSINSDAAKTMQIGTTQQLTATIVPADATNQKVTWSSSNEQVLTVSETGLVVAVGAGSAKITATADDKANGVKTASLTITVEELTMSVASEGYTGIYDGSEHSITVTAPEGASVKYGTSEGTYDLDASPSYTDAGNYTVYYQVTKKNYATIESSAMVSITKAPLTISVGNYSKKQYDPMPEFSVSYDGFKNNEAEDELSKQPVITCEANEDSAPGEYDITLSGAEAANYDITYVTGKLTVTEPNSYTLTYIVDGKEYQSFSIKYRDVITPLAAPEKEGYTFSGWSEIPDSMPANDVVVTGTFTINKYKLTYMIDDKVYKDTVYEYSATIIPEPMPAGNYVTFEWTDLPETMPAHDVVVHASYTTGIRAMILAKPQDVQIYSPNGKKLNKLQKGLNIIRMSNGKTQKVVVK